MGIPGGSMDQDGDEAGGAAARLEAALDRIARLARQGAPAAPAATTPGDPDLAPRLDALIAELRAALGPQSGTPPAADKD